MKLRFLKIFPLVSFLVFSITFPVSISAQTAEDEVRKNQELSLRPTSTMDNPYELVENWPTLLPGQEWGAAIGLIPDDTGGLWMMFRSEPPINYITADGQITKSFGDGMIVQAHGFCMDNDGNLWAGDSGPFGDDPSTAGRGFQIHKFSQEGEHLLSLGEAGVSRASETTFIGPTACAVMPDGNILIADGHWPRPSNAQQDGDRLVVVTPNGEFVRSVGSMGAGPGEFMGPHTLAIDADGRVFVGDRSNNRVQIFTQEGEFLAQWNQFGRPSGVFFDQHGRIYVADSESDNVQNPGWEMGIRIGEVETGWVTEFILYPWGDPRDVAGNGAEFVAVDRHGNIYGGEPRPRKLQKYVRMRP